jgi:biotin synthase
MESTWNLENIAELYEQPVMDLIFRAQSVHRANFPANTIQAATLLSIKTGSCPEDCAYCPQSIHNQTELETEKLMDTEQVVLCAKNAKKSGATRFCMGAAYRDAPTGGHFDRICNMVKEVKDLGLETCMTLGMLNDKQAAQLAESGLDYYNHNIDSSKEYYEKVISTRTYQERLDTIECVRQSGMKVCCGGIIGMGEERLDRIKMLNQLANQNPAPESVPINNLVKVAGTKLADVDDLDEFEFIRTVAVARIIMPTSYVRLSAGRESMSETMQALCFLAGANSVFYGDKLLTTPNPATNSDLALFNKLNIQVARSEYAETN